VGSGSCGRDLSLRSRATSGGLARAGTTTGGAPRASENMAAVERREASAPSIALPFTVEGYRGGAERLARCSRRASVNGTPRCGDPHQRLSALRPLVFEGRK
jgi:hypothetical protein